MKDIIPQTRGNDDMSYMYTKYAALPKGTAKHSYVAFYEFPPGKSNYPYHYHLTKVLYNPEICCFSPPGRMALISCQTPRTVSR